MEPLPRSQLRIYPGDQNDGPSSDQLVSPQLLAARELLRPVSSNSGHREIEPFTRAWFEELELKRYSPHGGWLRRCLEFSRHPQQKLIMIGPGLGTDALQYQRHTTEVTICCTPQDHAEALRRNFEFRGTAIPIRFLGVDQTIPFDRGSFDLAYWNLLYSPPSEPGRIVAELYRVLKPGGKIFVLAPSRYDPGFWQNLLLPYRRWYSRPAVVTDGPRYSARALKKLLEPFSEHRSVKRHLRKAELPHIWRFIPHYVNERIMGRVLVIRAFKPLSAAFDAIAEDRAA